MGTDTTTPAAAFPTYFEVLTTELNPVFPMGDSPWLPFCVALNEVQLTIHSLLIAFLRADPMELFPTIANSIYNSRKVRLLAARFLDTNVESRAGKTSTSVIVSVHPGDVPTMRTSIRTFSPSCAIQWAYCSKR